MFNTDEFRNRILIDPMDQYFDELDSCLRYGGDVPLTAYDFLKPLIAKYIRKDPKLFE